MGKDEMDILPFPVIELLGQWHEFPRIPLNGSEEANPMFGPKPADQANICLCAWVLVFVFSFLIVSPVQLWYDNAALSGLENQILCSATVAAQLHYSLVITCENSRQCWKILSQRGGGGGEARIHFARIHFY